MKEKGKSFEELVQYVYQSLLFIEGRDIQVLRDTKLIGRSGEKHQIDAFYEFDLVGIKHKVAIECKNHNRPITKGSVLEFYGKLVDLGNCMGIMVSSSGFQQGALSVAKTYGIELISLGELPLLGKVVAAKIGVTLPDDKVWGQPFWTLMGEQDGEIDGSYIVFPIEDDNAFYLFTSRKTAELVSNKAGGVVRGVSQLHLKVLLSYADYYKLKFMFFAYDEKLVFKISPDEIREHYLFTQL